MGYQFGQTKLLHFIYAQSTSLDGYFLDGIHGPHVAISSPLLQVKSNILQIPCTPGYTGVVPSYFGYDYVCDTGYLYNADQ